MSSFEDTRHVVQGSTGGSNDDTTAYNDVLANGSTLTFTSINGDQKSVSVTGGAGGSVQAFNGATLDTATNEVTFTSTTGALADEVVLDLDPMLTSLESTVGGHTTDITNIKDLTGTSTLKTTVDANTDDITDIKSLSGSSHLKTTITAIINDISDIEDLTGTSTLKTTVDNSLKSIEIDGNGHLRGKRHDNSYTGRVENLNDAFISASLSGNVLSFGQISGSTTAGITLPAGGTTATSVDAITFNFTVQTVSGSNKYFLHGDEAGALPIELNSQRKYIFTFPAAHPLKLSLTADGTHGGGSEYTTGVTYDSTTQLTYVNAAARTTANLYYYCANHANMGGAIIEDNGFNNITSITYDSSVPKLEIERAFMDVYGLSAQSVTLSDSFVSAQKDGDNIKLTKISGAQTTVQSVHFLVAAEAEVEQLLLLIIPRRQ